MPYISTSDITLQNFPYKIVWGILPTNSLLVKYKIKNNNVCDLCNNKEETLTHLFWECTITQALWKNLKEFLKAKNTNLEMTMTKVILNCTNEVNLSTKNFLISLMKRFIYLLKLKLQYPSFPIFLKYLRERIEIEHFFHF